MFPEAIETGRLRLRRLSREEVPTLTLYEHAGRSETVGEETEYVSWGPHATPKESLEFLTRVEERWEDREVATYAVYPREGEDGAGEFAGDTGLNLRWERRTGKLGVWLRKPFWGRGYSGERADALLKLAFDRLDLDLAAVCHVAGHERSRRAIEKYVGRYGGRCEGLLRNERVHGDDPVDVRRYSISQAEWRDSNADPEVRFVDGE